MPLARRVAALWLSETERGLASIESIPLETRSSYQASSRTLLLDPAVAHDSSGDPVRELARAYLHQNPRSTLGSLRDELVEAHRGTLDHEGNPITGESALAQAAEGLVANYIAAAYGALALVYNSLHAEKFRISQGQSTPEQARQNIQGRLSEFAERSFVQSERTVGDIRVDGDVVKTTVTLTQPQREQIERELLGATVAELRAEIFEEGRNAFR